MNTRLHLAPANARDWRALLLFPLKVYVVLAPLCFYLWNSILAGNMPRRARIDAAGTVEAGYTVSIVMLLSFGALFLVGRHPRDAVTSLLWALSALIIAMLWVGARGV